MAHRELLEFSQVVGKSPGQRATTPDDAIFGGRDNDRDTHRGLVKLNSKYKDKGLVILSVSVDKNQKDWKKAISKDKMSWLHVNDPGGWDANVAVRWNVSVLPTTFLIDKNGDVVSIDPDPKELEQSVKKLLEE